MGCLVHVRVPFLMAIRISRSDNSMLDKTIEGESSRLEIDKDEETRLGLRLFILSKEPSFRDFD